MPEPWFYLRRDEAVLRRTVAAPGHAGRLFVLGSAPLLAVAAAAFAYARFFEPAARPAVRIALYALPLLLALVALAAWRIRVATEHALTDARIYARRGRLFTRVHFTTHDKVTDLRFEQDPLERVFGVATLVLSTAGGDVRLSGLADALAWKEACESARDAFVQRLVGDAATRAPRAAAVPSDAAAPGPAPAEAAWDEPPWPGAVPGFVKSGDRVAWVGAPRPISALGAAKSLVGVVPPIVLLALAAPSQAATFVALVVLAAPILLAVRVAQLRRMAFVVTDRRVYARSGVVGTTVAQLTYDKITDITYRQDLFGRVLGYGGVTIATAGGGSAPIVMQGLARPLEAKELVERLRSRAMREAT